MSRDIFTVIHQIIECVPEDDPCGKLFLEDMVMMRNKLAFISPEQMYDVFQFNRIVTLLIDHFGEKPPIEGWRKDVYDVWMDTKSK